MPPTHVSPSLLDFGRYMPSQLPSSERDILYLIVMQTDLEVQALILYYGDSFEFLSEHRVKSQKQFQRSLEN